MKVLTLVSAYPSREDEIPNTFVHKYIKALQRRGETAYVLCLDFRSPRKRRKLGLSSYEYDGVKVYKYAFPCGPVPYLLETLMYLSVRKLYRYAEKHEGTPNVVHAHFGNTGYVASRLKKKYGIPYIVTEHSSSLLNGASHDSVSHKFFYAGYKSCDKLVAVSNSLCNAIASHDPSLSPEVIPNVLSEAFAYEKCEKYNDFTVVSVGRLDPVKRFDLLIRSVAELAKLGESVKLKIIGDGTQRKSLESLASSLGVSSLVEFTGFRSPHEICEIFNRSHLFALTSDTETFGVVYIEANACGLPAVATDCGGPADIINGDNGIIIPKNDVSALSDAILKIKKGYIKYDPESIAVQTKNKYGGDRIAGQYMKLYEEACR